METDRASLVATAIVVGTGALWGFYWLPVRALSDLGLTGGWGTLAITLAAVAFLSPVAVAGRGRLLRADRLALASIALGGGAFALYSVSFVYGRVAIVILLYFLTPVWSTLIARYALGWKTTRMRLFAIALGLAGLTVMLGADGDVPMPEGVGEWMALLAGLLWSIATTGIRTRPEVSRGDSALVFAIGAAVTMLALAPLLEPFPQGLDDGATALALALATAALWWGLSIVALMWAAARLEPARVGILLMAEVPVGAASAAMLAGEQLARLEVLGGLLVLCAGVLEVWPARRAPAR